MKKAIPKLVLRRETIRALDGLKLERVRGGDGAVVLADTGAGTGCPVPVKPPG